MLKNKGFTLIEVLATITLLSVIAIIIYPNMTRYFNKSKEDAFEIQIKEIEKAAHEWTLKNSKFLPEEKGESITIFLLDLKKSGLIDIELMNPKTNKKFPDDMVILIIKTEKGFEYEVDVDSGTEVDDTDLDKPSIILKGFPYQYVEINDTYKEYGAIATDSKGNDIDEDEIKITIRKDNVKQTDIKTDDFYEYELTYEVTDPYNGKKAKAIRKVKIRDTEPPVLKVPVNTTIKSTVSSFDLMEGVSATDNSKKKPTIEVKGNVALGIPGSYVVQYIAKDGSGNKTSKKRVITIVGDICIPIKVTGNIKSSILTNKNVILEATYANNSKPTNGSFQWQKYDGGWKNIDGETSSKITLSKDTKTKYRVIHKYGECSVVSNEYNVFIDKTKPVCVSSGGLPNWTNGNITLIGTCSDVGGSGCVSHISKTFTETINTSTATPGTVYDKAGNSTLCPEDQTVKIDKVNPASVSASKVGATTKSITVKANGVDNHSGIGKYEFSKDNGTTWVSNGTNNTYTFTSLKTGSYNMKVRITDIAGNTTTSAPVSMSTNTVAVPTYSVNPAGDVWAREKVVTITYPTRQTDFVYQYSVNGGASWATVSSGTTATYTFTANGNIIARIYDGVNYFSASTLSVTKIDRTAPTLSYSLKRVINGVEVGDYTSNVWTNASVARRLYPSDTGSGVAKVQYNTGDGVWHDEGNVDYWLFNETNNSTKYRVIDNVGNISNELQLFIKVDKTAPTCSVSKSGTVGNNGWYKSEAVSLSLAKDDTGGSGLAYYGLSSSSTANYNWQTTGTQSDTAGVTWYGYVKDAAGNTATCNSGSFKVDTYAYTPTATPRKNGSITCNETTGKKTNTVTCTGSGMVTFQFDNTYHDNLSGHSADKNWFMGYGPSCKNNSSDSNLAWGQWLFNNGAYKITSGGQKNGCENMVFKVISVDNAGNQSKELVVKWDVYY